MNGTEYQRLAMSTSAAHDTPDHRTVNAALGLVGEAGEVARLVGLPLDGDDTVERLLMLAQQVGQVADHIKKGRYHGHSINNRLLAQSMTAIHQSVKHLEWAIERDFLQGAPERDRLSLVRPEADRLTLEAGDVLWYVAQLSDSLGITIDEVMTSNIDKLRKRYPEGFSEVASRERAE